MSEGLNECRFIGNLGEQPSLRYTQSQQGVLNLRIACTERYLDSGTKEWKERTEWVSVVVFGKRAEALNKFLAKGSKVYVGGRLQTRSWEDKTGAKRYTTEIVAQNILLLGGKSAGGGGAHDEAHGGGDFETPGDDEIPF